MRRTRFTRSARQQAREAQAWWREHREAAPALFADELERALHLIVRVPACGRLAQDARLEGVRRVLLPRTRYGLYYRVAPDGAVQVLAIWHAERGSEPENI